MLNQEWTRGIGSDGHKIYDEHNHLVAIVLRHEDGMKIVDTIHENVTLRIQLATMTAELNAFKDGQLEIARACGYQEGESLSPQSFILQQFTAVTVKAEEVNLVKSSLGLPEDVGLLNWVTDLRALLRQREEEKRITDSLMLEGVQKIEELRVQLAAKTKERHE